MSKAPLGQMIIELGLDSTDFGKGLQSSKREIKAWSNEMSQSMRLADYNGDKIGKLQARYDGLTKIISAQEKQVKSLQNSYKGSFDENGKATAQTEKLAAEVKEAESKLVLYNRELRNTAGELAKMRIQTEGWTGALRTGGEGLQRFGKYATTLGDTLTKRVSLPLMAGVTLATKAASDWESSFAGVMKTNDEVIDSNGNVVYSYKDLENGLRDMAKELPATHSEIAEVAEAAGQLGIEAENVTSFTRTMIDMGESTNLSAESAANSLARLANITGMSQNDFDRLGSAIVGLGNNFATTEAEITDMALRLAGTGNQIGMTEADILGLAAAMSSVGINAEAGGTAMSTVLKKIQNAVADGSDDLIGFAKVARMSASEFADAFEKDPARALQAFVEGLELSSNEGENLNAVLGDLGIKGIREADTLLRLAGNSALLGDALDLSATSWDENTALAEEAGLRYETLESQLGMLRNEAVDVAIDFGGPFVEALREGLDAAKPLIGAVSDLAQSFADADPKTQQAIIKMVGFGIAAGPVIGTVGRLSSNIGGATVKTVDFLAEMAKKKAIADFGGAAVTASGTKGIGAMTGALSTLNPWLIGLVGVGGLLTVGYGAWKLWGEEVYEAGERTQRWGTDVGESTDSVLTDIESVTGKFGLMKQGISTDSESMIGDFRKIGNAINDDLNSHLEATEEYLAGLPETLRESQQEILQEYQDNLNEALEITENNSAEIEAIHQRASDENRELTRDELEYIRSLQNQSLSSYLSTLELSAEEEKAIRQALTGDIADTTREQGKQMLALLSQQEQGMAEARKIATDETHRYMEDRRIDPDSKLGKQLLSDVNRYHDALVVSNQRTMKELIDMYPELEKEVDLSTGRMIDRQNMTQREYDEIITMNRILLDGWADSHRDVAKAAEDANSYIVDVTSEGAKAWNDVVLESGGNMDTFREKLIESTKETTAWNDIRLQLKNADLDSNAKLVIGEAAIANGWWDGMAWEDKQAVLKDNFSEVVYQAIVDEGTWDKLTWEEQIAVLNNEFSDTVAQSLIDRGMWRDLTFEQKQAILTTNTPETLVQALKDMGLWDRISPEVHKLLLDSSPAEREITSTTRKLNKYGDIDVEATLDAKDNTRTGVESARRQIESLPSSRTTTLTTVRQTIQETLNRGVRRLARGTDYHLGGPAIVNDQPGSLFRELIQYPTGEQFIPHGRNVYIPDMPRGAKVLKAFLTKQRFPDIPQYASGIGNIPVDSTVIQNMRSSREIFQNSNSNSNYLITELLQRITEIKTSASSDNRDIKTSLELLIDLFGNTTIELNHRELGRLVRNFE